LLAFVPGLVNQRLLQSEYLAAENRILRSHLPGRSRLSDPPKRYFHRKKLMGARLLPLSFHYDRHAHPRMDAALKVMFAF
jgi:hypothetical protein